jgi:hypothetical protein
MMNPLESIKDKIEEIKAQVKRDVQIEILRETASVALSRLATLDTDRAADYLGALNGLKILLAIVICAASLSAQRYTLGTDGDGCSGGAPLTVAGGTATTRWGQMPVPGDFVCTFNTPDGLYSVRLDFLEPCYAAGACAGGQITKPGQRLENIYIRGGPIVQNFDPYLAGATDKVLASATYPAFATGGSISVRVQTVARSAVLAAIEIQPVAWINGLQGPPGPTGPAGPQGAPGVQEYLGQWDPWGR